MIVRELVTKLGFSLDKSGVKEADKSIAAMKKKATDLGKSLRNIGKGMNLYLTTPIIALGAGLVKVASDAEETESKFATVFSGISEQSERVAKDLSRNFGLSSTASKQLLSDTGDLLTGFNFSQKQALELSESVNKLAVDLASFTNFSGGAEGASQALTKALLGERESIKSLGIAILEEDVKKQVQLNRAKGLTFETERQAKAYATLILAQNQSKNAIGDFARTSGSFANRLRIFRSRLNDVAKGFGNILLPYATRALEKLTGFLEWFDELEESTKKVILVFGAFVAALGPLLFFFGKILTVIGIISSTIGFGALGIILAKVAVVVGIVTGALTALYLILEDIYTGMRGGKSFFGDLFGDLEIVKSANKFLKTTKQRLKDIALVFEEDFGIILKSLEKQLKSFIIVNFYYPLKLVLAVTKQILSLFDKLSPAIGPIISPLAGPLMNYVQKRAQNIRANRSSTMSVDNLFSSIGNMPNLATVGAPTFQNQSGSSNLPPVTFHQNVNVQVDSTADPKKIADDIIAKTEEARKKELRQLSRNFKKVI